VHLVGFIIKKFNTEGFYVACRGWGWGVGVSHNILVMKCLHFDCIILQTSDCWSNQ